MSRAARLLALMDRLRMNRHPVSGADLAQALGVSLRTLYRDIATLQGQGAPIAGEAGLGYVLEEGYFLPPLNFTPDEAEALLLGLSLVQKRGGGVLAQAAQIASGKIEAVLPARTPADAIPAMMVASRPEPQNAVLDTLRHAIRRERKVAISYQDAQGEATQRVVWPILIGLFESMEMLAAWCELRVSYRHFRLDRIMGLEMLPERVPRRRPVMLADWRRHEKISARG